MAIASYHGGSTGRFKEILDAEGIQHIVFTAHLSSNDHFSRTIKDMLFESVQHTGKDWPLLIPSVIKQYDNTIHDSIKFKPIDATEDSNAPDVNTI